MGIIFLAPWLLELYLLVPEIHDLSSTIIVTIIAYGIANIIIVYCRIPGVKAMKKCFPTLLPAQNALLPSSTILEPYTKQRYYQFFSNNIAGFQISTDDNEMVPHVSTAISWLIIQTRDCTKFPLIAEENINFGFSYNLLGLKPYGIVVSLVGLISNSIMLFLYFYGLLFIAPKTLVAGFIINLLFLLLWLFIITNSLVISCGKKYARALLSACDSLTLN